MNLKLTAALLALARRMPGPGPGRGRRAPGAGMYASVYYYRTSAAAAPGLNLQNLLTDNLKRVDRNLGVPYILHIFHKLLKLRILRHSRGI